MKLSPPVLIVTHAIICCLFASHLYANDHEIESLFIKNKIEGSIIISSLDGSKEFVHNRNRSEKRFLPASTFKIINSLIALQENAISDENETITWDGEDKGWSPWNKDQTLSTALPESCVWFYQELAKRVGNNAYLSHLQDIHYGNEKTGPELTTFWLNGELAISSREQIDFLKKLYKKELPYSEKHIRLIEKLLLVESRPGVTIRAKTGWAMRITNQHGWYIGYVEKEDETWFFATNIQIDSKLDAKYRKEITQQALKLKNIL